jgi:hypothetical protein
LDITATRNTVLAVDTSKWDVEHHDEKWKELKSTSGAKMQSRED